MIYVCLIPYIYSFIYLFFLIKVYYSIYNLIYLLYLIYRKTNRFVIIYYKVITVYTDLLK